MNFLKSRRVAAREASPRGANRRHGTCHAELRACGCLPCQLKLELLHGGSIPLKEPQPAEPPQDSSDTAAAYRDPNVPRRASDPPIAQWFRPEILLGSLFLSGFAPVMRGTAGTLLTALAAGMWLWLAKPAAIGLWCAAGLLSLASFAVAERALARQPALKDPSWFVLDEAAAFMLMLALLGNPSSADFCFAFMVFRFYDIAKPWPVSSFEHLPRGIGILADDLAAACLGAWTIWTVRLVTAGQSLNWIQ